MLWEIHRVTLDEKVQSDKLFTIDFTDINPRQKEQQELLFLLCKAGVQKDLIDDFYQYRQSVNRYTIGALLTSDAVTNVVRRELRKLKPGIKVEANEISELIKNEVIKRDALQSEAGIEAVKQVTKFIKKQEREKAKSKKVENPTNPEPECENLN